MLPGSAESDYQPTRATGNCAALETLSRRVLGAMTQSYAPAELLQELCQACVIHDDFKVAWISWYDAGTRTLVPIAHAGDDGQFLSVMPISLDKLPPEYAPGGLAFQSGQPYIDNNIEALPAGLPWRDRALAAGLRSAATIPLHSRGTVRGIFGLFSTISHYFQDEDLLLLVDLGHGISFALANLSLAVEPTKTDGSAANWHLNRIQLDAVFQNLDHGILVADREGSILAWNRSAAAILGLDAIVDVSRRLPQLSSTYQASTTDEIPIPVDQRPLARVLQGERISDFEIRIRRATSGTDRLISCSGSLVTHSQLGELGFVIFRDITESNRLKKELKESNSNRARSFQEHTSALIRAKDRAESADRLKSAFLATMSHELRTPLNSIIGLASLLMHEKAGPVNTQQAGQLQLMNSSARHLLGLINDILDISKIEAGQLEITVDPYDVASSLEQVMAVVKPYADKKGLNLRLELSSSLGQLSSDRRRVEQILLNLLTNAVKFTDRGEITLIADIVIKRAAVPPRRAVSALRLRVVDTGVGIKSEDLLRIFQSFRQLNARAKGQQDSSGLGLAICRSLADLLGAEIGVTSEVGRGSVFTLTLPLNPDLMTQ